MEMKTMRWERNPGEMEVKTVRWERHPGEMEGRLGDMEGKKLNCERRNPKTVPVAETRGCSCPLPET